MLLFKTNQVLNRGTEGPMTIYVYVGNATESFNAQFGIVWTSTCDQTLPFAFFILDGK